MDRKRCVMMVLVLPVLLLVCVVLRRPPVEGKPVAKRAASKAQEIERPETASLPILVAAPRGRDLPPIPAGEGTTSVKAAVRLEQDVIGGFWTDLGTMIESRSLSREPELDRRVMIAASAKHLGLDRAQASAFEQTALEALMLIGEAWKIRDAELLSLPSWLSESERAVRERELQDRYEDAKRLELQRIEAMLGESVRHVLFRERLAEWVDAVR